MRSIRKVADATLCLVFGLLIFLAMKSCETYDFQVNENDTIPPDTLIFVGKGTLYGAGDEGITKENLVIKTKNEWDSLITKINSVNNESSHFEETDINFSKYQVFALFEEVKGSGGWSIDITNVIWYADSTVVVYTNLERGSGLSVMCQPYYIAKIPVSNKEIIFYYEN